MATINFLYRSKKPEVALTLRLLYRHNERDYVLGTKTQCFVSIEYWEKYHYSHRVRDAFYKNIKAETLNHLHGLESHVLNKFNNTSTAIINKDWLKSVVSNYYNPKLTGDIHNGKLIPYIDSYIQYKGSDLAIGTIKKYRVVQKMLLRYQINNGTPLMIMDINLAFKQGFEKYCFGENYAQNTIAKALKVVKTICNHAKKRGMTVSNELDEVKLRSVETETIYLTPEDLNSIQELKNIPEYLDNARDWLLISCYTGQRISDFMRYEKDMISLATNKKGEIIQLLEFNQVKTKSPISLPLDPKVIQILENRSGRFPRKISDQTYNRFIKEVCQRAGLTYQVFGSKKNVVSPNEKKYRKKVDNYEKWELVTSHIGRRTFATNNFGSIPVSYLAYITGHKSERMLLTYMGKNNRDMALEISEYF